MRFHRGQQTALLDLLAMLAGTPGDVLKQGLLTDLSADAGLFGPDSVTWRVLREPLLLLGGSRALLMQVAHPLVAQGVIDHSRYEAEPFGRLLETSRWVYAFGFGNQAEARKAVQHLHGVHRSVRGCLPVENATAAFVGSTPYDALDPGLGVWVYATLVQSMLLTYQALIGDLSDADAGRFVREWAHAGALLDVRPSPPWDGEAALHAYIDRQIAIGGVRPNVAARRIAETVLRPPLPWPQLAPLSRLIAFTTTGLLPPALRKGFGLPWSSRLQRRHAQYCRLSRFLHPYLPRKARVSPLWQVATRRVAAQSTLIKNPRGM
jgi:uncharacterized protein (DUF2236 family)